MSSTIFASYDYLLHFDYLLGFIARLVRLLTSNPQYITARSVAVNATRRSPLKIAFTSKHACTYTTKPEIAAKSTATTPTTKLKCQVRLRLL